MTIDYSDYERQAKARWGETAAYQEYKEKSSDRSDADNKSIQA